MLCTLARAASPARYLAATARWPNRLAPPAISPDLLTAPNLLTTPDLLPAQLASLRIMRVAA
ncbi:MAG: hypothetical protein KHW47_02520 [Actinotignum schaalii]|nr:hypothetical protein [Actinotignum schaalii]